MAEQITSRLSIAAPLRHFSLGTLLALALALALVLASLTDLLVPQVFLIVFCNRLLIMSCVTDMVLSGLLLQHAAKLKLIVLSTLITCLFLPVVL